MELARPLWPAGYDRTPNYLRRYSPERVPA